jgi:uncharacterized coiled-coil DUF342 family protein
LRTFPIFIWLVAALAATSTAVFFIARDEDHDIEATRAAAFVEQEIIAAAANGESLTVLPSAKVEPQPQAGAWIVSGQVTRHSESGATSTEPYVALIENSGLCRSLGDTKCWRLGTLTIGTTAKKQEAVETAENTTDQDSRAPMSEAVTSPPQTEVAMEREEARARIAPLAAATAPVTEFDEPSQDAAPAERDSLLKIVRDLNALIDGLEQNVATLEIENQATEEQLAAVSWERDRLSENLSAWALKRNESTEEGASRIAEADELRAQVDGARENIEGLTAELTRVSTEREELTGQVAELSAEGKKLAAQVGELAHERQGPTPQLAELAAAREALTARISEMSTETDGLSTWVETLTAESETLSARVTELMEERRTLSSRVASLSPEAEASSTQVSELKAEQEDFTTEAAAKGVASGDEAEAATEPTAIGTVAGGDPTSPTEESQEFSPVTIDLATRWKEFAEQLDLTGVETWLEDDLSELPLEDQKTAQTKSLPTDPAVVASDQALIQLYQKVLENAGFNPGPIDGQFGPRTVLALRSYQTAVGLAPSGAFDKATLETLNRQHRGPAEVKLARAFYVSPEDAGKTSYKGLLAALVGLLAITLWLSGWRLLFRRRPA